MLPLTNNFVTCKSLQVVKMHHYMGGTIKLRIVNDVFTVICVFNEKV